MAKAIGRSQPTAGIRIGDADFYGSMGGHPLNSPIVGVTVTAHGYVLAAADGGVFAFGDAPFFGSMAGQALDAPIAAVGAAGSGYYLAGADGGIFAFEVPFTGSFKGCISSPVIAVIAFDGASDPTSPPYWYPQVVTASGDLDNVNPGFHTPDNPALGLDLLPHVVDLEAKQTRTHDMRPGGAQGRNQY